MLPHLLCCFFNLEPASRKNCSMLPVILPLSPCRKVRSHAEGITFKSIYHWSSPICWKAATAFCFYQWKSVFDSFYLSSKLLMRRWRSKRHDALYCSLVIEVTAKRQWWDNHRLRPPLWVAGLLLDLVFVQKSRRMRAIVRICSPSSPVYTVMVSFGIFLLFAFMQQVGSCHTAPFFVTNEHWFFELMVLFWIFLSVVQRSPVRRVWVPWVWLYAPTWSFFVFYHIYLSLEAPTTLTALKTKPLTLRPRLRPRDFKASALDDSFVLKWENFLPVHDELLKNFHILLQDILWKNMFYEFSGHSKSHLQFAGKLFRITTGCYLKTHVVAMFWSSKRNVRHLFAL